MEEIGEMDVVRGGGPPAEAVGGKRGGWEVMSMCEL